jgi:tetratricopeptide (TPR) repeat protein
MNNPQRAVESPDKYAMALSRWMPDAERKQNHNYLHLMVGICFTKLGNFELAEAWYERSLEASLRTRHLWYQYGTVPDLLDPYMLTRRSDLKDRVIREVKEWQTEFGSRAGQRIAVAQYAYAVASLLSGADAEALQYVPLLTSSTRIRWGYAVGWLINAVARRDQAQFEESLEAFLKVHARMARFGVLRETPEGFLCLPAMSLTRLAMDRGMSVDSESEYLSLDYLAYLRDR